MRKSKILYINKDEIAALKLTGTRLREARELFFCLNRNHAAKLMGTSDQALTDAENGRLNPLPIKFLKVAAETYGVSTDWLLGLVNDDWERSIKSNQERDFLAGLQRIHLKHYSQLVARQMALDSISRQAIAAIVEIAVTFEAFLKANPEFDDMLVGARLLRGIHAAADIAQKANHEIKQKNN